jgi:hypothetical protein
MELVMDGFGVCGFLRWLFGFAKLAFAFFSFFTVHLRQCEGIGSFLRLQKKDNQKGFLPFDLSF